MTDSDKPNKRLSRRRFVQVSSLLALGLAYQKPVIETLQPKAMLGQYGQHGQGDGGGGDNDQPGGIGGNQAPPIVTDRG